MVDMANVVGAAGVTVERGLAGEFGDLPAVTLAGFGQPGHEHPSGAFSDVTFRTECLHQLLERQGGG